MQQLHTLGWDYDEFRSHVQLGDDSHTDFGTEYPIIEDNTDLDNAILGLTHELNNAINADALGGIKNSVINGSMPIYDFVNACGLIEVGGLIDQIMVSQDLHFSNYIPDQLYTMTQAYRQTEFTFAYFQNYVWNNYANQITVAANHEPIMEYYVDLYNQIQAQH